MAVNSKEVLVFDTNGRFLYKVDKLGSSQIAKDDLKDFEVDHLSGEMYVYFSEKGYIVKCDVRNGEVQGKIVAPRYFSHFSVFSDHLLFFRDGNVAYNDKYGDFRIYEFNHNKDLQKKWLNYPINPNVSTGDIYHFNNEDSVSLLISRFACDTIFRYKKSTIEALYRIEPPFQDVYDLRLAKNESELGMMIYSDRSSYFTDKLFDTKDKLYFLYKRGKSVGLNIFDKKSRRSVFMERFNYDISEILIRIPEYISDCNFVSVIYPYLLKQQVGFISHADTRYDRLKSLAAKVCYKDNLVICLVTLKK